MLPHTGLRVPRIFGGPTRIDSCTIYDDLSNFKFQISTFNFQLSIINYQLSILNYQFSTQKPD